MTRAPRSSRPMRATEPHPQQARENPEPHEATNPVPWIIVTLTSALLAFGISYIALAPLQGPARLGDERSVEELRGARGAAAGALDGAAIYAARCAACHQATGTGLPGVFPPLAASEWVVGKDETLAAIVLRGIGGPLTVRGTVYDGAMPAFAAQLQDAELAAVLTFVRSQWGNTAPAVSAETVARVRSATVARAGPFGGDAELDATR